MSLRTTLRLHHDAGPAEFSSASSAAWLTAWAPPALERPCKTRGLCELPVGRDLEPAAVSCHMAGGHNTSAASG